jgi:hypothetical protein
VSLSWYRHTQLVFSGGLAPLTAQRVDGTGTEQQGGPPLGAGDGMALTTCLQSALWRTWRHKYLRRTASAATGSDLGTTINYLCGAAGIGLGIKNQRRTTRALNPVVVFGGKALLHLAAQKNMTHAPLAPLRSTLGYFLCKWLGPHTQMDREACSDVGL